MKKSESYITSFLTAFSVHFLFLFTASIIGIKFIMVSPEVANYEEPKVIEIGEQEQIPQAAEGGMPDDILEIPEIEDELWEELEQETKPLPIPEDILNQNAPKPPKDISKRNMDGDSLDAASKDSRSRHPSQGGVFGKKKGDIAGPPSDGNSKKLFGESVDGRILFLFDISGSMKDPYGRITRLEALKAELIKAIRTLDDNDEFDCVGYGGDYNYVLAKQVLWGALTTATESNKAAAIDWVNRLIAWGSTPTYQAMEYACKEYPTDLDSIFLITDGFPDGDYRNIVKATKTWWKRFKKCELVCVSIGGSGLSFIKELAGAVGGSYVVARE